MNLAQPAPQEPATNIPTTHHQDSVEAAPGIPPPEEVRSEPVYKDIQVKSPPLLVHEQVVSPKSTAEQADMSRATGESAGASAREHSGAGDQGGRSLTSIELERDRRIREHYIQEKWQQQQQQQGSSGKRVLIELLDEGDLDSFARQRSGVPANTATASDLRLQQAAKQMGESLYQKAGELKDTALSFTSSIGKRYSSYLPSFPGRVGQSDSAWEKYARTLAKADDFMFRAERKTLGARKAQPQDRSAELHLQANKLRNKALQKALKAQQIAASMKQSSERKLMEIQQGLSSHKDTWELYGATMLRVQELLHRSDALFAEANSTWDKMKAAELRTDAIHIRKKALRKAKKLCQFADEIQKHTDHKVEELRQPL